MRHSSTTPVFVDDSRRRSWLARTTAAILTCTATAYTVLLASGTLDQPALDAHVQTQHVSTHASDR